MSKNWGSDIVPSEKWVDTAKEYRCDGKKVVNLEIILYNSNGKEATFPVKGTVIVREKPLKTEYRIWTLDGRASVMGDKEEYNLVKDS